MTVNELLFHLHLISQTPIERLANGKNYHRYMVDELPKEKRNKNYIYFLIVEGQVIYVGQANQGFCRRINEHRRHLLFFNYIVLELKDCQNVWQAEKEWIDRCNPVLNGVLTPWEKYHCKSTMGFIGTVQDVLQYAKITSPYSTRH